MNVRLPDGTIIRNVPEGTTKAQLAEKLKANGMAVPAEWMGEAPQLSTVENVGGFLRDIPRQVGLTARYALEGLPAIAEPVTEPIRRIVVNPLMRAAGSEGVESLTQGGKRLADSIGLPEPRTATERVVGDASRTVASSAGMAGAANKLAALTERAAPMAANVFWQMAARPGVQAVAAAGAGAAGGTVRETGGSPAEQFGAALLGGLVTGYGAAKTADMAERGVAAVRSMLTPKEQQIRAADQAITLTLQRSGIDWNAVPVGVKNQLREEVAQALNTGQPLNEDALRRLVAFRRTGTTPTVGMLTQDEGLITREMNLAKTGANSMDQGLQRLPRIQNQNAAQLLRQIDNLGAANAPDAAGAGARQIGALSSRVREARGNIDSLYSQARDSQGRSVVLDGPAAAQAAIRRLQADNVGKLPPEVDDILNDLTSGKTPLTVEYQQQLVKNLYRKMQGAGDNGDLRYGLRIVREELDNADVPPTATVNPGNLPAVPGTVPQSTQQAGQQAIDAYRRARAANRAYMQTLEANPALAKVDDALAALEGNPQLRSAEDIVGAGSFVQQFVTGKSATPGEVRSLLQQVGPQGAQALRQYVARVLRDAATNSTDDITKFSNDAYRRALRDIGDEKLAALFSREELDQLKAIGDAGKYMQAQPTGSAVNNSNSGALVLGRGLDLLDKVAGSIPLGGRDILKGYIQGAQQTQVLRPQNALVQLAAPKEQPLLANPLLAASVVAPSDARKDQRRDKRP